MRTLGIQFEEHQLRELKALQKRDRRSIGLMVREAVDDFIAKRHAEIEAKRQEIEKALVDTEAMLAGMSDVQRKRVIDHVRQAFVNEESASRDLADLPERVEKAKEGTES